jgi:hypothetical protein
MKKTQLTPTTLRLILIAAMAALAVLAVVVFMVGYGKIKEYAVSTQTVAAEAQASDSSLQNLITLKKELETETDAVQRASMIVSESKSYLYQDQIIQDINRFADNAGIVITNISFSDTGTASTTAPAAGTAPASGAAAPATGTAAAAATGGAPSGIKTTTATVTVKNPVDYNKMLTFIHSIEGSLFKMRISQVGLSKSTDAKSPNDVTSDVFTIEVYLR